MFSKFKMILWEKKYMFLFISLFIIVVTQRFINERQHGLANSVSSDGTGYYCYLPAAVIYQDFSYAYYSKPENRISHFYKPYINPYKDGGLNKYYCGTALCLLPFFLIAIIISAIAGTDINGYTDTFLMMVSIAPLIYYALSVFFLSRVARFFSISEKANFVACLIFLFGTNFYHYVIQEPSMSHAYSFFAVSLFLFLYTKVLAHTSIKNLFLLGLALGLIVLIRPVNIIVVLFTPFFSESIKEYFLFLKSVFLNHIKGVLGLIAAVIACVAFQFLFYYLQTGEFFIVSYEGESFNFAKPEIYKVLFSYRKGLFIYTPMFLASILFVLLAGKNWYKKIIFFITFLVFLYVTSSWWCWYYGGGFSNRPFIDILPLFIIITLLFYYKVSKNVKRSILIICLPLIFMNQFMAYQYSNAIMHSFAMDEQKFWDIFLETDLANINQKRIDKILKVKKVYRSELLNYEDIVGDDRIVNGGYHSNKSAIVGEKNFYSKGFEFSLKEFDKPFYLIIECMAKTTREGRDLGLIVSIDEGGNMVKWDVVFKNQFHDNKEGWAKMTQVVEIEKEFIKPNAQLKIFANTEKSENFIDDLKYTIVK